MNSCPPFVRKIFQLVSDTNTNNIVSWSDNGKNFTIWNAHAFQKQILPQFFKHNNLCSFIRQLNTYGFHKVSSPSENLQFSHPYFQKDGKHLLNNITRKSKKKTQTEDFPSSPDFPISDYDNANQNKVAEALIALAKRQIESERRLKSICAEVQEAKSQINILRSYPLCGKRSAPSMETPYAKKIKTEHIEDPTDFDFDFTNMLPTQEMISFDDLFHVPSTHCSTETKRDFDSSQQPFDVNSLLLDF